MSDKRFPVEFRLYLACGATSSIGSGLVLPFTAIYITQGLRLSREDVGIYFVVIAVSALASGTVAGFLIDRFGVRFGGLVGALSQGVSYLLLGTVSDTMGLVFAAIALGWGDGLVAPCVTTTMATVVPPEDRPRAFAFRFAFANVMACAGAGVGALLVSLVHDATGFRILMITNAVSFVPIALYMALRGRARLDTGSSRNHGGYYRTLLRNRLLLALVLLQLIVVLVGYSQLETSVTLLLSTYMHLSAGFVGVVIIFNMLAVFVLQKPVRRVLDRQHITSAPVVAGTAWLFAFGCGAMAAYQSLQWVAIVLALAFATAFAFGEVALSYSFGPLLLAAVTEALQSRASSLMSMASNVASISGPAIGALVVVAAGAVGGWLALGFGAALVLGTALHLRTVSRTHSPESDLARSI